jgi:LacI family transcriptional regulator
MALGAMSAAQARGLQIGSDISITGFDDIPAAEYAHPALTTIHQPIPEIGKLVVNLLDDLISGRPTDKRQILLDSTLVTRASTGHKKGGERT